MSLSLKNQLAEDFLKDLDDDDEEEEEEEVQNDTRQDTLEDAESHQPQQLLIAEEQEDNLDFSRWEIPDAVQIYLQARRKPRELLTILLENQEFQDFLALLQQAIDAHQKGNNLDGPSAINHDQIVDTLNKCNAALLEVDQEILSLYRYIKDIYNKRFPELDAIVTPPLDYIEVVKRLQNQLDVAVISSLGTVLPNSLVMATNVAASVTIGKLLTFTELRRVLDAIEEVDQLVQYRKTILQYIEIHLCQLAPNLTALAGSSLAAGLVTHAGSLKALADMPAQNILLIGGSAYSRAQTAFSSGASGASVLPAVAKKAGRGYGIIWHSDLVQSAPPQLRVRALRLMSGKCALAARTDVYHPTRSDAIGRRLREEVVEKLRKAAEPPPPQLKRILPVPDERPRSRRGGKRSRRAKEKYGMSELQKQANRLGFGLKADGDYGLDEVQPSLGMIGTAEVGRLKLKANDAQRVRRPTEKIRKGILMDLI